MRPVVFTLAFMACGGAGTPGPTMAEAPHHTPPAHDSAISDTGDPDTPRDSGWVDTGIAPPEHVVTLHSKTAVRALHTAGDLDADGHEDLILGQPDAAPGGEVWVIHGGPHGLDRPARVWAGAAGERAGIAVAGGADANDDGVPDLVISVEGGAEGDRVLLVDGATADLLRTWRAPEGVTRFGASVDMSRTAGTTRIAVGAPGGDPTGAAFVFDARAAAPTLRVSGEVDPTASHEIRADELGFEVYLGECDGDPDEELVVAAAQDWYDADTWRSDYHVYDAEQVGMIAESSARKTYTFGCHAHSGAAPDPSGGGALVLQVVSSGCYGPIVASYFFEVWYDPESDALAGENAFPVELEYAGGIDARLVTYEVTPGERAAIMAMMEGAALACESLSGRSCTWIDGGATAAGTFGDLDGDGLTDAVLGGVGMLRVF